MSEENVEIVRRGYEVMTQYLRDYPTAMPPLGEFLDPEIEWRGPREFGWLIRCLFQDLVDLPPTAEGTSAGVGVPLARGLCATPSMEATVSARDTARAMPKENVEIVRAAFDALNRGDVEAAMKDLAPDAEYDVSRALGPFHGVYRGRDEIRRVWEEFAEPWESVHWGIDEFIGAGDQVATPFTNVLRGRDGIEVQARAALLWTLRNGTIISFCFYQERQEALEAAGLSQ